MNSGKPEVLQASACMAMEASQRGPPMLNAPIWPSLAIAIGRRVICAYQGIHELTEASVGSCALYLSAIGLALSQLSHKCLQEKRMSGRPE